MKIFLHRASFILCSVFACVIPSVWIIAAIKHERVLQFRFVAGISLAWFFAIINRFTRPFSNQPATHRGTITYFIHRASFELCIVCVAMLPIGIVFKMTERGELAEHYFSGFFPYAWLFATINYLTRHSGKQRTIRPQNAPKIDSKENHGTRT